LIGVVKRHTCAGLSPYFGNLFAPDCRFAGGSRVVVMQAADGLNPIHAWQPRKPDSEGDIT
jgi:hypothetical protein